MTSSDLDYCSPTYSKPFQMQLFTARRYASPVYAMGLCLSVSVCVSQFGVLLKQLDQGSE